MPTDDPVDREVGLTANIPPWDPQPSEGHWGRILDPVRAAALHEAVVAYRERFRDEPTSYRLVMADQIVEIAERFERYLAGEEAS